MKELITSENNSLIKEVKHLKNKKYRNKKGLYFIEGVFFVKEALKEHADIKYILISEFFKNNKFEIFNQLNAGSSALSVVSDKVFKKVSDTENPQGILAVIGMSEHKLNTLKSDKNFLVVLEKVQDPGNAGTIIRTADAAGATGIILSGGCVDLYNPKVLRATMGSIFHIPVYYQIEMVECISILNQKGIQILACDIRGDKNIYNIKFTGNTALIIGNEANGISQRTANAADDLVRIPMPGRAESLNASVAAALLIYEVVRYKKNT